MSLLSGTWRICHITPHLPPDQAANALLPFHLGVWARDDGHEVSFVAHPPRAATDLDRAAKALPGRVSWVPSNRGAGGLTRLLRLGSLATAARIARAARPLVAAADLVHVHSNGLLAEMGALVAQRLRKPYVLTLYGTEIWHYAPRRPGPDLFTRAYRRADFVTFYSHGLQARAVELGLARHATAVVYPPVAEAFKYHDEGAQADVRAGLGIRQRHVLVNVKRLHPLAGQRYLIEALGEVVRVHPDTRLVICGTGPLLDELKDLARAHGVERHVTFAGLLDNATIARYDAAADAFVLPSLLEACPTVALEALASGTPVVAADSPGGLELHELFGYDVTVVPRGQAEVLAQAIVALLDAKRRTRPETRQTIEQELRPGAVHRHFMDVYRTVLEARRSRAG